MREKTKIRIYNSYRTIFFITGLVCLFNEHIAKVILPFFVSFAFIFGGIVGLLTNRNARDPNLTSPEGSVLWRIINMFQIGVGILALIMYYILTRKI